MKNRYLAIAFVSLFSTAALAGYTGPGGGAAPAGQPAAGYTGPAAQQITTVAEALKAQDDTPILLEGHVTKKLGKELYEFKDATGTIKVDIDDEDLPAGSFNDQTKVRLHGEVDTHKTKDTDIDVDRVEVIK